MGEEITFIKNDTVRAIETLIERTKVWAKDNEYAKGRETALVITKLEEARLWALDMVNHPKEQIAE